MFLGHIRIRFVHTSIAEVARPISITSTTPLTASLFQHLHHLAGDRVGDAEPAAKVVKRVAESGSGGDLAH